MASNRLDVTLRLADVENVKDALQAGRDLAILVQRIKRRHDLKRPIAGLLEHAERIANEHYPDRWGR